MATRRDDERPRVSVSRRAALVSLLVVLLGGMALRSCLGASGPPPRPAAAADRAGTLGPRVMLAGMPAGYAHSRAGALAAATTLVGQGQRVFGLSADARDGALRAVAAREAANQWVSQQDRWLGDMDQIAAHSQAPVTWQVGVLATRVDTYTPGRARVSVWRVGILSTQGFIAPVATCSVRKRVRSSLISVGRSC